MDKQMDELMGKGRLQNPTAGWPTVPPGYGRLPLFRTKKHLPEPVFLEQKTPAGTGRNRQGAPVDRRLGFEAVPKQIDKWINKWINK